MGPLELPRHAAILLVSFRSRPGASWRGATTPRSPRLQPGEMSLLSLADGVLACSALRPARDLAPAPCGATSRRARARRLEPRAECGEQRRHRGGVNTVEDTAYINAFDAHTGVSRAANDTCSSL